MSMATNNKPQVLNPLTLRNTVGAELADILEARGIFCYNDFLGVSDLRQKEKLSQTILKKLNNLIPEAQEIILFLESFQEGYLQEKTKCQESYSRAKKNFTKLKKAIPLMKGEFNNGIDLLDDIIDFFGVDSEEQIFEDSERQAALFRKQNKMAVDPINLHIWLRRGELDFKALSLPPYDEDSLMGWIEGKEWEQNIENPYYFKNLPTVFANFGIALVLVPYLEKTVYGAIRWIDGHPLIEISDRNQDLATCWFTLFHEIGHVILHKNSEIYEGEINTKTTAKKEKEANKFANKYLFNGDDLRKAVFNRKNRDVTLTARELSREFGVKIIFAAYWLRKAQYYFNLQPHISIAFIEGYQ